MRATIREVFHRAFCTLGLGLGVAAGGCGLLGIDWIPEDTTVSVQFYTTPFLCESDETGEITKSTNVIVHNPEANSLTIYRRGVLVNNEGDPLPDGVSWVALQLAADEAVRLDCDAFVRVLTGDPTATFASEFGPSAHVDGFLTIGVQAGGEFPRIDASVQFTQPDGGFTVGLIEAIPVVADSWPPVTE